MSLSNHLGLWFLGAGLVLSACTLRDPNAPRQEVQSSWPNGDPKLVLGFRADTVYERLEYHETGQLKSRGQLLRGERHGVWNSYYDTGMPWSQVNCDAGVEDGSYRTYHPNGEPAIEGTYSGGQRTGTWRFFSPEGALLDTKEVTNLDE
jgi:hypothetical protein